MAQDLPTITLKKITPDLGTSLKEVRLAALQESPGAFGSTYEEESRFSDEQWLERASAMSRDNAIGYLALSDWRICGLVRGSVQQSNPLCASIASLWVHPEYRRAGVAAQLLSAVQSWAAGLGAGELTLNVTSNNEAALALYSRHGFQPTGRTEQYPNDPDLFEIELRKSL